MLILSDLLMPARALTAAISSAVLPNQAFDLGRPSMSRRAQESRVDSIARACGPVKDQILKQRDRQRISKQRY